MSLNPAPSGPPVATADPRNKLHDIAEFHISAQRITQRLFFRLYTLYSWANEIIAAFAGLGIGYPLLSQATGAKVSDSTHPIVKEAVTFFSGGGGLMVGFILAVVWVLLKTAVTREDGLKRAVLMRTCVREIRGERVKVNDIIRNEAAPLNKLGTVYSTLLDIQQRHLRERGWPFEEGFAPGIEEAVEKQTQEWYQIWQGRFPQATAPSSVNIRPE